ncbi:hypothetical protein ACW7BJ_20950 [Azospirillum argentinense]
MTESPRTVPGTVAGIEVEMAVADTETINATWIRDDLEWFKANPGRHHRYRLVMEGETDGDPEPRQPAVLVHRSDEGDLVHLYIEDVAITVKPAFEEAVLALAFAKLAPQAKALPVI